MTTPDDAQSPPPAPRRGFIPMSRPMPADALVALVDGISGSTPPPITDTPGVPTRTFTDTIKHFEARLDAAQSDIAGLKEENARLGRHIAELEAVAEASRETLVTVLAGLAKDKSIRTALASGITYVGYAVALSILIVVVATVGASLKYGDLSILTNGAATSIEAPPGALLPVE